MTPVPQMTMWPPAGGVPLQTQQMCQMQQMLQLQQLQIQHLQQMAAAGVANQAAHKQQAKGNKKKPVHQMQNAMPPKTVTPKAHTRKAPSSSSHQMQEVKAPERQMKQSPQQMKESSCVGEIQVSG